MCDREGKRERERGREVEVERERVRERERERQRKRKGIREIWNYLLSTVQAKSRPRQTWSDVKKEPCGKGLREK